MTYEEIGDNAGVVWRALATADRKKTVSEIAEYTGLSREDVAAAIGWLARENKIMFMQENDATYFLLLEPVYY